MAGGCGPVIAAKPSTWQFVKLRVPSAEIVATAAAAALISVGAPAPWGLGLSILNSSEG